PTTHRAGWHGSLTPGGSQQGARQTTNPIELGSAADQSGVTREPSLTLANSTLRSWSDRPALPGPATEPGMAPDLSAAHSA
ncbi:Os01g0280600, partial [Oryza sativa Japonica Group]